MLTNTGLNQVATKLSDMIVAVQINDADIITDFTLSEVVVNVFRFSFDVPIGVTRILNLKMMDSANDVVGELNLNFNVETDTSFKMEYTAKNATQSIATSALIGGRGLWG